MGLVNSALEHREAKPNKYHGLCLIHSSLTKSSSITVKNLKEKDTLTLIIMQTLALICNRLKCQSDSSIET